MGDFAFLNMEEYLQIVPILMSRLECGSNETAHLDLHWLQTLASKAAAMFQRVNLPY